MKFITNFLKNRKSASSRNKGLNSLIIRDYNEAIINFEKALEIFPDDDISLLNLGYSYTGLKKFDEAKNALVKAVKLASPVNPAPEIALAMVYYETENFDLARNSINNALKIDIKHPAAHYYLGLILLKENRVDEATEEFEEVISEKPTFVQARMLAIGEAYLLEKKIFGTLSMNNETDINIDNNKTEETSS